MQMCVMLKKKNATRHIFVWLCLVHVDFRVAAHDFSFILPSSLRLLPFCTAGARHRTRTLLISHNSTCHHPPLHTAPELHAHSYCTTHRRPDPSSSDAHSSLPPTLVGSESGLDEELLPAYSAALDLSIGETTFEVRLRRLFERAPELLGQRVGAFF